MTDELTSLLEFRPGHLAWPIQPNLVNLYGEESALHWLRGRKAEIIRSEIDPLRAGYEPHIWKVVDDNIADLRAKNPNAVIKIMIWGGHRSSKTRKASNFVNRDIYANPDRRWWCCDSTEAQARANQMRLIYEQFPPEWKNLARNKVTDVGYSISDGFSKNKCVFPNKSEIDFKFYSMKIESLPGPELDGVWCDELVPLSWVEFLVFRLVNRNGILLITFCPEFGWNETFGYFYEGAQLLEDVDAPLLPKYDEDGRMLGYKKVPRVMQCRDSTARIIYFHTSDNPFSRYDTLVHELKGKSEEEILIRAYGVATRSHAAAFPMFNRKYHVITQTQFAEILKRSPQGERFHLVDPCDGRMWFMIWAFCPRPNKWIIYREYPSYGYQEAYIEGVGMPGPWAVSGEAADGVKGRGQDTKGFALDRYIEEILKKENGEQILGRYIDSRYATSPKSSQAEVTTLIEQMSVAGMDFIPMTAGVGKIIKWEHNDGSVDMINTSLYYDLDEELGKWSKDLGRLNEPQLQILETCPNTIYALEHWTGADGQRGACKDPVDCLRGLFLSGVNYVGKDQYVFVGGGIPR